MSLRTLSRLNKADNLAKPDQCKGCGKEWKFGGWVVHHGWASCDRCGLTYCIIDYDDDDSYNGPNCVMSSKFTEAVSDFYEKYNTNWKKSREKFDRFVDKNYPELIDDE